MSEKEIWYRAEDITWAAPLNEYDEPSGPGRKDIIFTKFRVLKHTPKGVWVATNPFNAEAGKAFVLKAQGGKRLCHPTKADALVSYIARKKRQHLILHARAEAALKFMRLGELALLRERSPEKSHLDLGQIV